MWLKTDQRIFMRMKFFPMRKEEMGNILLLSVISLVTTVPSQSRTERTGMCTDRPQRIEGFAKFKIPGRTQNYVGKVDKLANLHIPEEK